MRSLALTLAVIFFVVGVLYGLGTINFFTESGVGHGHHFKHLIACWFLALLCFIWARFTRAPARY